MVYHTTIRDKNGECLWKGNLSALPCIGHVIVFNNCYVVKRIAHHFFTVTKDEESVTIFVEKE